MYETETLLRRQLRVRDPAGHGRIVLRTELDWDRDLEQAWGRRLHSPLQLGLSQITAAARGRFS
jgi:hypothetical protein